MPHPDVAKRHEITIRAPAALVMEVARNFDIQSIRVIRVLFWMRARILGSRAPTTNRPTSLVSGMLQIGWKCLADEPGSLFIAGAACQPWRADVTFAPIAPEQFAGYAEPDRVKILWTLQADALGPENTRFSTETRVVATDDQARMKFRRYWGVFGVGIVMIRLFLLTAVRRDAERRWRGERLTDR